MPWCGADAKVAEDTADRARSHTMAQSDKLAWMRRCPQLGFSRANRRIRSPGSGLIGGRPDREGKVHFFAIRPDAMPAAFRV